MENRPKNLKNEILDFFKILFSFKPGIIFIEPTKNPILQFFRYAFVGAIASLVDWGVLYAVTESGVVYLLAAVFGFIFGLITNFSLSKFLVFRSSTPRVGLGGEFVGYALIGLVGLVLTLILMYFMTDILGIYYMISKIVSTLLILVWNFAARRYLLYK
ncbi:MAG: GtrA family protein [Clostridiales bacterium]|nr:GtrA family protein [Clostridiales bacterium]